MNLQESQESFEQENISSLDHDYIRSQKVNTPRRKKHIHIPRYYLVVVWGFFMIFVVYSYSVITLNELNNYAKSYEYIPQVIKVPVTIEFLPNEPEPQLAPQPLF